MMVTFHSKAWNSVTMFGDVAAQMLKMMGHSGTIPSALMADDVPRAMERLQAAVNVSPSAAAGPAGSGPRKDDDNEPPPVNLRQRAFPLLELLSAAARQNADVTWEKGAPTV